MPPPEPRSGSEPRERHLEVPRTARFWVLGEEVARPRELWIALHGYGQLARRFLRRFEPVADGSRRIVAPEALSRFYVGAEPGRHGPHSVVGATWMTREDREREIADYVRYLDALAGVLAGGERGARGSGDDAPRLTILGFSQGVATAARWVALGAVHPARLVLWGDTVPPDLPMDRAARALEGVDLVLVRGAADRAVSAEAAATERARLDAAGIGYRELTYDGGHDVDAATLERLAGVGG